MKYDAQGRNMARIHRFTSSNTGNLLHITFLKNDTLRVECDKYLYKGYIYTVNLLLTRRPELNRTPEPFYCSSVRQISSVGPEPTKKIIKGGLIEEIVFDVNGFLVDKPAVLENVHRWTLATEYKSQLLEFSKIRQRIAVLEIEARELQNKILEAEARYPDINEWVLHYTDQSK